MKNSKKVISFTKITLFSATLLSSMLSVATEMLAAPGLMKSTAVQTVAPQRKWVYQTSPELRELPTQVSTVLQRINTKNPLTTIQSLPQVRDDLVTLVKVVVKIVDAEIESLQTQMALLQDEVELLKQQVFRQQMSQRASEMMESIRA